jgi:hypothetical protein
MKRRIMVKSGAHWSQKYAMSSEALKPYQLTYRWVMLMLVSR